MAEALKVGPLCHCGHGMHEHYMCGAVWEMGCYRRDECGCTQYVNQEFTPADQVDAVRRRAAEMNKPKGRALRRHRANDKETR